MSIEDILKQRVSYWLGKLRGVFNPAARLGLILCTGGIAATLCLWLFAKFAEELTKNELTVFDTRLSVWVHHFAAPATTEFMKLVSNAGGHWLFLGLTGLGVSIFLYRKRQHFWDAVIVQLCLWGGFLFNFGLKYIYKRERPSLARLVDIDGFSFPSGHSMVSFAFYGMLLYLIYNNWPPSLPRTVVMLLIACFILLVGVSRIYLGVHYPSDVIAGFAAGGVWLALCIAALETARHYQGKR